MWDSRRAVLWWTDIESRRLYRHDWASRTTRVFETPERVGSFALGRRERALLIAFESGIAFYRSRRTARWSGLRVRCGSGAGSASTTVASIGAAASGLARWSRGGRATAPAICIASSAGRHGAAASQRRCGISNSLCTSPDGAMLYFADTRRAPSGRLRAGRPTARSAQRRRFAETPRGRGPRRLYRGCGRLRLERAVGWQLRRALRARRADRSHVPSSHPPANLRMLRRAAPGSVVRHLRAAGSRRRRRCAASPTRVMSSSTEPGFRDLPEPEYRR